MYVVYFMNDPSVEVDATSAHVDHHGNLTLSNAGVVVLAVKACDWKKAVQPDNVRKNPNARRATLEEAPAAPTVDEAA